MIPEIDDFVLVLHQYLAKRLKSDQGHLQKGEYAQPLIFSLVSCSSIPRNEERLLEHILQLSYKSDMELTLSQDKHHLNLKYKGKEYFISICIGREYNGDFVVTVAESPANQVGYSLGPIVTGLEKQEPKPKFISSYEQRDKSSSHNILDRLKDYLCEEYRLTQPDNFVVSKSEINSRAGSVTLMKNRDAESCNDPLSMLVLLFYRASGFETRKIGETELELKKGNEEYACFISESDSAYKVVIQLRNIADILKESGV